MPDMPASIDEEIEVDPMISHYETMPREAVKKELKQHGINPQPTIESVKKLVSDWERSKT
jgi:hypothetical protein